MKKLLGIATIILVILASGVFSIAYAATELWDDFTVHAAQGQTVYPNYPDFSSKIGKGLTKDDFIITYSMSGNPTSSTFVFDSNGALTVSDTVTPVYGNSYLGLDVTYTPKKQGVGKETIIHCRLMVYTKIEAIELSKTSVVLSMDYSGDYLTAIVPWGSYKDWLSNVSYDHSVIDVKTTESLSGREMIISISPVAPGKTTLVLTTHNGVTAQIPVTIYPAPTKVEFAKKGFTAQLGDVVDLGLDLGNGSLDPMPTINVTVDGLTWSGTYPYPDFHYFPGDATHFHACTVGEHLITVTTLNGLSGSVWVSVYESQKCAAIKVDAEKIYARNPVRVILTDAEGKEISAPITISKGADFARLEGNQLIADKAGLVELTVHNADGSVCSQTFHVEETPTRIILEATDITLEIGESYQVNVGFDQGSMPYTISLSEQTKTEFNLAATQIKNDTITALAPGKATYIVRAGDLSQQITVTVPDSDLAVYLVAPPTLYPAKHQFQFAVKDKGGRTYPARFEVYVHHLSYASITEDGFFTSKQKGPALVTATLNDGRQLSIELNMVDMPLWLQHSPVTVRLSSTYYMAPQSDVGGISPQDVIAVVADESIVKVENGYICPQKIGKTTITITSIYTEVCTTFSVEVIKDDDDILVGERFFKVPYGYSVQMPIITDGNGKQLRFTWEITSNTPGAGNPNDSGFILEDDILTCTWPSASCEITGTQKNGAGIVKVSAVGYLLPSAIFIEPSSVRLKMGDVCYATLNWLDSSCQVEDAYWTSEDPSIVTCAEHTTGRNGLHLIPQKPGVTRVIAMVTADLYAVCEVEVYDDQGRLPGDANDDGTVNLSDAVHILRKASPINESNADVNSDGMVDMHDALLLMQYLAGWKVTLQ